MVDHIGGGVRRTLTDALRAALRAGEVGLNVCLPARVESYDSASQKASVQPLIKTQDGEDRSIITGVPVVFPRAGGAYMHMPVTRGTGVMLVFADRSLDRWLTQGGNVEPKDGRAHAYSDAIAIPGLSPFSAYGDTENAAQDDESVEIAYQGGMVKIDADGRVSVTRNGESLRSVLSSTMDVIDDTLSQLSEESVTIPSGSSAGNYPLDGAAEYSTIASDLAGVRDRLNELLGGE